MKQVLKTVYGAIPFKRNFYLALRKVWKPREDIYRHLHFKGTFPVKVDAKAAFMLRHYGYQIENEIFWKGLTGGWEKQSMAIWISLCRDSSVIFDVGANTGIFSLVAKAVQPEALVHAFEPVKRVFDKLVENNRLNGFDIVCHELAISNVDGHATIYDTMDEHILSVTVNKKLNPKAATPVIVKTARLSSIKEAYAIPKINLIKIDVETHEPEVLDGLEPYLTRDRPTLLVEVLNEEVAGRVEEMVRGKNYLYFNIDEENGVRRTDTVTKSDHFNYLICSEESAKGLGFFS